MTARALTVALAVMFLCNGLAPEGPTRQPSPPPRIRLHPSPMVHRPAPALDSARVTKWLRGKRK